MSKAQEAEMLDSVTEEEDDEGQGVVYGDGPGEVCPRRTGQGQAQPVQLGRMPCMMIPIEDGQALQVEPARYGIVQTITRWNDADKKLSAVVIVDERPFRSDEAGILEALGEHTWVVGDEAVICCTTILRAMSLSGPGRIVEAWHYPIGRGTD